MLTLLPRERHHAGFRGVSLRDDQLTPLERSCERPWSRLRARRIPTTTRKTNSRTTQASSWSATGAETSTTSWPRSDAIRLPCCGGQSSRTDRARPGPLARALQRRRAGRRHGHERHGKLAVVRRSGGDSHMRSSSACVGPGSTSSRGLAERRVSRSERIDERSLSIDEGNTGARAQQQSASQGRIGR